MSASRLLSHSTCALAGQDKWMGRVSGGEVPYGTPVVTQQALKLQ